MALTNLSQDPGARHRIVECGGMKWLVELALSKNYESQRHSCCCLANMCIHGEHDSDAHASHKGNEGYLDGASPSGSRTESAACTILNAKSVREMVHAAFSDERLIKRILKVAQSTFVEVQQEAMVLLLNLSFIDQVLTLLVRMGAVQVSACTAPLSTCPVMQ